MLIKEQLREAARAYNDGELTAGELHRRIVVILTDGELTPIELTMSPDMNWLATQLVRQWRSPTTEQTMKA